jgi:hypothetical protein
MRLALLVGIVLVAAGSYSLVRGLTYTSQRSVLKLGDLEASVEEKKTIPTWLGVAAVAGGALLVGVSIRRRPPGESS